MKGIASYISIALGIILILAAILWWAIAVNALVKLPDNIDVVNMYEGEVTYYVDIETGEPLAPGSELKFPLEIEQDITSDSAQYDSNTAVIKEVLKVSVMNMPQDDVENSYILDRKSMENKDDGGRSYAFRTSTFEGEEMNRGGDFYPQFPIDTSKDETYLYWKNEVAEGIETEFLKEDSKEGVTVYDFRLAFEEMEVTEGYIEQMGLPTETSFEQLKPTLAAMGVDVDGLIALATQVIGAQSPEDLQALNAALQQSIPLTYYWSMDQELSIEPKTGTPVDLYINLETLTMKMDTASLEDAFAVLAGYAGDATLGPALAPLVELQTQIGEAQKIFEQAYTTTEDTRKTAIADAKDDAGSINVVKVYIPWALLIVGAFILIFGLLLGGGQEPPQQEEE